MVRYYRRRPVYRAAKRRRARTTGRTYGRRKGMMGNRFRMRYKAKKGKWQKFTFFGNISPPLNIGKDNQEDAIRGEAIPNRPPISAAIIGAGRPANLIQAHEAESRTAMFGQRWTPPLAGGVVPDADGNPVDNGDGLMIHLAQRDGMMGFTRWDYGGLNITEALIGDKWNAINNAGLGMIAIPAERIYVKGVRVSVTPRTTNRPGLIFIGKKSANKPMKITETVGSGKVYIGAVKNAPGVVTPLAAGVVQWNFPSKTTICAPIYNRVKIDVFYKIKLVASN